MTELFADGANLDEMIALANDPQIKGFTTNPTLLRKAGVMDYEAFGRAACAAIPQFPISFEVLADDPAGMEREARIIAGWGENAYVKIPVTTTDGHFTGPLIARLQREDIAVNVTAILTFEQVRSSAAALVESAPSCLSVFAGRIADTGRDPVPFMVQALEHLRVVAPQCQLIWASPREIFNLAQADQIGCHIITMTPDLLSKRDLIGKSRETYSLETVQMFYRDGQASGLKL